MSSSLKRLFFNKYTDRVVFHHVPSRFHSLYKLFRHGTYDAERVRFFHLATLWLEVNDVKGNVCEFGTASGESFLNFYFQFNGIHQIPHFYLFDSFEGLPDIDEKTPHEGWHRGQFACSLDNLVNRLNFNGIPKDRYTTVKGFYENSLSSENKLNPGPLAVVHIDCDLFDSTRLALNFVTPYLQAGTLMLFDDYYCSKGDPQAGERGAFEQWLAQHKEISAIAWMDYSIHGKAFILHKTNTR